MGHGGFVPGTLLRDQVLRRQVKLNFISSEFPVNAVFRTSLSFQSIEITSRQPIASRARGP